MPQIVIVTKYDPSWRYAFIREKQIVSDILGDNAVAVYHIGSTSVPGLPAKPIIDIMPVVKSLEAVDAAAENFEKADYEYMGEFGIPGRRYLRKGGDRRTHQIHVFHENDRFNIIRHLAVRDYLRAHADDAEQYGNLKMRLARLYPHDIEGYCDGKEQFVLQLEKRALQWYEARFGSAELPRE